MADDGSVFGARLGAVRQLAGLSQEDLAERSGLSVRAISNLERGRTRAPHPDSVRRLADALDLHEAARAEFFAAARPPAHRATAGGAGPAVVPRQLPAAVNGFAGRPGELTMLDRLTEDPERTDGAVVISAIDGMAGVGKTALAIHWAHRVADRFPDGQLYVNLRGFDPGGRVTEPAEAVRGFLDALGVPAERVPFGLDAQTGLYRSLLAGRRMLVVLDNARDAGQVQPLLPGTPTALAVVTSRNQLTALVAAQGASPVTLDLLTLAEARELLARRLGAARVATEPQAADQIIARCARLPLALTIAAARAARSGFPLASLAEELADADGRLDALSGGEPGSRLRAVFSWSYATLSTAAARLFRLLGLHPGPDITAAAAGSLAGGGRLAVRTPLAELTGVSLLAERAPGRYTSHDLLRVYAAELTHDLDAERQRHAAIRRMLDHYLYSATNADRLLNRARDPIPLPLEAPAPGVTAENPIDHAAAMAWLDNEQQNLLSAVEQAVTLGLDTHAWQLAWALDTHLQRQGHWHELTASWQAALDAADRLAAPVLQAYARRRLARASIMLGRYRTADTHLRRALYLYAQIGDHLGEAQTHHYLTNLRERQHRPRQALAQAQQALDHYEACGHRRGQAQALNTVGWCHALLGDYQLAITHCQQALSLLQTLDDREGQANAWDSLGYVHHHLADHAQALDCYRRALTLYCGLRDRFNEAATLTRLGETHHATGNPDAAHTAWQHALDILTDLDHPDAAGIRTKMQDSGSVRSSV
jgi:tetratricopeptide (TPR) repeat protein/transcriptional regulator with XRE-family HTH domain